MKDYLIPREVNTRFEIFPGFGFMELAAILFGGLVGAVLQIIPMVLPIPTGPKVFARLFLVTLPLAISYMMVRQDIGGDTLFGQLKAYRKWSGRRKTLYYRKEGENW